jgi:hypothetical protein
MKPAGRSTDAWRLLPAPCRYAVGSASLRGNACRPNDSSGRTKSMAEEIAGDPVTVALPHLDALEHRVVSAKLTLIHSPQGSSTPAGSWLFS